MFTSGYKANNVDLSDLFEPNRSSSLEAGLEKYFTNNVNIKSNYMSNAGRGVLSGLPAANIITGYKVNDVDLGSIFQPLGYGPGVTLRAQLGQENATTWTWYKSSLTIANANNGTNYVPRKIFFIIQAPGGDGGTGGPSSGGSYPYYGGGGAGGGGAGGMCWGFVEMTNVSRIAGVGDAVFFYNAAGSILAIITTHAGSRGGNAGVNTPGAGGIGGAVPTINDYYGILTIIGGSAGQDGASGGYMNGSGAGRSKTIGADLTRAMFNGTLYEPTSSITKTGGGPGVNGEITIGYDTYVVYGGGGAGVGGIGFPDQTITAPAGCAFDAGQSSPPIPTVAKGSGVPGMPGNGGLYSGTVYSMGGTYKKPQMKIFY